MKILLAVDPFGNLHKILEKADLIIVGHRERNRLAFFTPGCLAAKEVADAHCSVLVIR